LVRELASIPAVATLPPAEVLQDFDAIQQLSRVSVPTGESQTISDAELMTALQ
jgi:hypothetical protein